jgi:hypothetical protein
METPLLPTPQKVISFHFKLDTDGEQREQGSLQEAGGVICIRYLLKWYNLKSRDSMRSLIIYPRVGGSSCRRVKLRSSGAIIVLLPERSRLPWTILATVSADHLLKEIYQTVPSGRS